MTDTTGNPWTTDLRERMIDALVKHGSPRADKPTTFGWSHPDWQRISRTVRDGTIDYPASSWTEVDWHEFMGTFYEGDTRKVGIDVTVVMRSGERFVYRYSGTVGELINAVVGDIGRAVNGG